MLPIPTETPIADPWVVLAYGAGIAAAALWLALCLFAWWRRRATNLTPVAGARRSAAAQPGFLELDSSARAAALQRADAYEQQLTEREAESRRRALETATGKGDRVQRLAGFVSLFMSLFTLASMIAGAVWQVSWIGTVMDRYSTGNRVVAVFEAHPVAFIVSVIVIGYHIYQFVAARKWQHDSAR